VRRNWFRDLLILTENTRSVCEGATANKRPLRAWPPRVRSLVRSTEWKSSFDRPRRLQRRYRKISSRGCCMTSRNAVLGLATGDTGHAPVPPVGGDEVGLESGENVQSRRVVGLSPEHRSRTTVSLGELVPAPQHKKESVYLPDGQATDIPRIGSLRESIRDAGGIDFAVARYCTDVPHRIQRADVLVVSRTRIRRSRKKHAPTRCRLLGGRNQVPHH